MDKSQTQSIGLLLLIAGLALALTFGGDVGFSAGVGPGLAYIGGFVLAFIGAYLAFVHGRQKNRDEV